MIDEELVRCRPCGYVMKASDLGDVCPACGLPRNVFEPYRERVSPKRLFLLNLDIHPISIHLSQTLVAFTPALIIFHWLFPAFQETVVHSVLNFSIVMLPLSLIVSFVSGLVDGITRFKTLKTPMLNAKIIYGSLAIVISIAQLFFFNPSEYDLLTVFFSLTALGCAIKLGLIGKHLIDVILPGTYVPRKKKKSPVPAPALVKAQVPKPKNVIDQEPTEN